MNLIESNVTEIVQGHSGDLKKQMFQHIERCGRTCYKSEDKITDDSCLKFIEFIKTRGHLSVFEHGTVYLYLCLDDENQNNPVREEKYGHIIETYNDLCCFLVAKYNDNQYSRVNVETVDGKRHHYITTNYRVIVENGWEDDLQYMVAPMEGHTPRYTFLFVCDRGVSHEGVRHRVLSFSQESTRFCNYMKEKFGMSVTFIQPDWIKPEDQAEFEEDLKYVESLYFKYLNKGYVPQQARYFLINGTKTEICITGFDDQWDMFFDLRYYGKAGTPHPDMLKVATMAFNIYKEKPRNKKRNI